MLATVEGLRSVCQHIWPLLLCVSCLRASDLNMQVVDHYEKPRNVGAFNKNDANVGTGLVGAPACGDVMKLQIRVSLHIWAQSRTGGIGAPAGLSCSDELG